MIASFDSKFNNGTAIIYKNNGSSTLLLQKAQELSGVPKHGQISKNP